MRAIMVVATVLMAPAIVAQAGSAFAAPTFVMPSALQAPTGAAVLSAESGIATQPGSPNPLAGRGVLLLKESFEKFLTRTRMFEGPPGTTVKVPPLEVWAHACRSDSPVCKQALFDARASFVTNAQFDMSGKVTFPGVPPGTYYLLVQGITGSQHLVWDLRVDLKAGANAITLNERNAAWPDAALAQAKSPAADPSASEVATCQVADAPRSVKAAASANSTLSVRGTGYVYTYTQTDRQTGQVLDSFTERGNFSNTTLYLLDEDADVVLQRAGVEAGLLGSRLAMFTFLDAGTQIGNAPGVDMLASLFGQKGELEEFTKERKAEFDCVMKAIRAHVVAETTTDEDARATFPGVAAGNYYLFGRFYRITKPVRGGGVLWNLPVQLKPGSNALPLSVDNAALK